MNLKKAVFFLVVFALIYQVAISVVSATDSYSTPEEMLIQYKKVQCKDGNIAVFFYTKKEIRQFQKVGRFNPETDSIPYPEVGVDYDEFIVKDHNSVLVERTAVYSQYKMRYKITINPIYRVRISGGRVVKTEYRRAEIRYGVVEFRDGQWVIRRGEKLVRFMDPTGYKKRQGFRD